MIDVPYLHHLSDDLKRVLLKFAKDRRRWLQWLFEAKKRYGLPILNYAVTWNHIHLLVAADGDRDIIPSSIKLIAGRTRPPLSIRFCTGGKSALFKRA